MFVVLGCMSYKNGTRHWVFAYPKHTMVSHHCVREFSNMLFELNKKTNYRGELIEEQEIKTTTLENPGDGHSLDEERCSATVD